MREHRWAIGSFLLALLVVGLLYRGPREAELWKMRAGATWSNCDRQSFWQNLFASKVFDRVNPALDWHHRRMIADMRNERSFRLNYQQPAGFWTPHPRTWNSLADKMTQARYWTSSDDQRYLLSLFDFQRDWDRKRMAKELLPLEEIPYVFEKSSAVLWPAAYRLELLLDSGDLAGHEQEISRVAREAWNVPPYQMEIRWVKNDPRAFRFVLDPLAQTHQVSFKQKQIRVGESPSNSVLAHELGHVLGFDDHYHFYWYERNCAVNHRAHYRDIMGNGAYGKALIGHWRLLREAYGRGLAGESFAYSASDSLKDPADRRLPLRPLPQSPLAGSSLKR